MRTAEKGNVYLVGSRPGDPELLTMRAVRLLEAADVVFHDALVSDEVFGLVNRGALVTSVGKRCGRPRITQAGICALWRRMATLETRIGSTRRNRIYWRPQDSISDSWHNFWPKMPSQWQPLAPLRAFATYCETRSACVHSNRT